MENYTGDDHNWIDYERSEQQPRTVEILMSTERPAFPGFLVLQCRHPGLAEK
jgi:hypothetical protein